jgi:acyl dehydratase
MDSSLVPLDEPAGPFSAYCDPDEIVAFALAINDPNPLYLDGRATPPTYAVAPVFPAFRGVGPIPPQATAGSTGGVHGTHDLYIHRPIAPGMRLHTTSERCSVVTSSAGMNIVTKLVSRDEAGTVFVEQYWSSLMRGPVSGGDRGAAMPDHSFPEEARKDLVGSLKLATTRDQTFRYAGASGDRAPMHVNDEVATGLGFPGKFNQGLCTLGVTSRALSELAAAGDPRRIRRVAVRFAAPSFPGDDIEVSVFALGANGPGQHAFAFEAASAGRVVLRHGRVEVAN